MALDHNHNGGSGPLGPDVARAIDLNEITAYFQPKVDLRSARIVGVEALARWARPELGLTAPKDFLGHVEASGQMRALTERMIEISTRAAGDWWRSGLGLQLSVNLSTSTFSGADRDLHTFVVDALSASGLPAEALQFEVTEDALLMEPERAAEVLGQLSRLGSTISVDDFGTGHFSLRRLMRLPIDELKIDRSLVLGLPNDEEDRAIARSIIHLAHQMGLQVVAEGVETKEQWQRLRSMGCERAQGFLISKPLAARDIPAWLATWSHFGRELGTSKPVHRGTKSPSKSSPARAEAPA
jgi:EAL domain-containing protein (putative c-di-GMP-specific phosphodiesterase class I)